jgi:hypothetical protein
LVTAAAAAAAYGLPFGHHDANTLFFPDKVAYQLFLSAQGVG